MTKRAYHAPKGNPCQHRNPTGEVCGIPFRAHRVEHTSRGDPCTLCRLPLANHYRKPRTYDDKHYYVGIDGEGQGREDHRYVMLAWSNEDGAHRASIEAPEGGALSTVQCLDFMLAMPNNARAFAYADNYDLTKILTDVDDKSLFLLARPELRQREFPKPPRAVKWNGYSFNLLGSKFTVKKGGRSRVVWDVFKFFQSKFTTALEDWFSKEDKDDKTQRVWNPPEMEDVVKRMVEMKDQRGEFDKLTRKQILDYCYSECAYMGQLAHKLIDAHEAAGLHLKAYHGAGSTATCILKSMGIQDEVRTGPPEMRHAIACGFSGGRFEHNLIGEVEGPIEGEDISSAYPYQTTFLPCLGCGKWELTKDRNKLIGCRTALVHYALGDAPKGIQWGPFPFRNPKATSKEGVGSISYPATSGGGWVWLDEYVQGETIFPHVHFKEAWIYNTPCNHQPFAEIPRLYLERLRIGKEGPGIVIKLGVNAVYGKTAQSLGFKPPFQSWIWAGMITSGCRAQGLELLGLHKDSYRTRNLLSIATDGMYTREKIQTPKPRDTGTMTEHNKPLGGWENKTVKKGMFFARPGIYFPANPTEKDIKAIRARGVGRKVMLDTWETMVQAWRDRKPSVDLPNMTRFHGMKSSISRHMEDSRFVYKRNIDDETGKPWYGQWTSRPVTMSFDPMPKREGINDDNTLGIRSFPQDMESAPYDRAIASDEALMFLLAQVINSEQPDGGYDQ